MTTPQSAHELTDGRNRRDALCEAHAKALEAGQRPPLATVLRQVPADERPELLQRLLPVEWAARSKAGETPTLREYIAALPEYETLIQSCLEKLASGDTQHTNSLYATAPWNPAQSSPTSSPARVTSCIGEYQILGEIARGGMGVVYKAQHLRLKRLAAVKLIRSGEFAGEHEIRRFHTEAAAAANLDHPGIVPVYEVGEHAGQHFLAMAFVDGQSLWERVKESPLEPKFAAKLMQRVAEAIQFAHDHGIIHRDIKPQNILITKDGQPRVTDFGLAKNQGSDSSLTETGAILGTPSYMPPEQAAGKTTEVGRPADVYSLGATLYCLLIGRPPFQAANKLETLLQVVEQEPVPPRQLNRSVPVDLETICLKCMQKEPAKRYDSATALAADLKRFQRGEPILARPVGRAERAWRWCRRNPVVAALSTVSLVIAGIAIAAGVRAIVAESLATFRLQELKEEQTKSAETQVKLGKTETELTLENKLRTDAERAAESRKYRRQITELSRAIQNPESMRTVNLLLECPEKLRHWEWYYLQNVLRTNMFGGTAFSWAPDGIRMAIVDANHQLKILDAERVVMLQQRPLLNHAHRTPKSKDVQRHVFAKVKWSPDGKWLAMVYGDADDAEHRQVRIHDAESGAFTKAIDVFGPGSAHAVIVAVEWSRDSRRLAISGKVGEMPTIGVYQFADGSAIWQKQIQANSLSWSADDRLLAITDSIRLFDSSNPNRLVQPQVLNADSGEIEFTLSRHTINPENAAFNRDGTRLFTASREQVIVWETTTYQPVQTIASQVMGGFLSVVWSDANEVAAYEYGGKIRFLAPDSGHTLYEVSPPSDALFNLEYARGGARLGGVVPGRIVLWDRATGRRVSDQQPHGEVGSPQAMIQEIDFQPWSYDGRYLFGVRIEGNQRTIRAYDAATGVVDATILSDPQCLLASWSPSSPQLIYVHSYPDTKLTLRNYAEQRSTTLVTTQDGIRGRFGWCRGGQSIWAVVQTPDQGSQLRLWSAATGAEQGRWQFPSEVQASSLQPKPTPSATGFSILPVFAIAGSPTEDEIAFASPELGLHLVNPVTGTDRKLDLQFLPADFPPQANVRLLWSSDGRYLAVQLKSGVTMLRTDDWEIAREFPGGVFNRWSPRGSQLSIYIPEKGVQVLSVDQWEQITTVRNNVAWSPDESRMVVIDGNYLELFDTADQEETFALSANNFLSQVWWSPDGSRICAMHGDYSRNQLVWDSAWSMRPTSASSAGASPSTPTNPQPANEVVQQSWHGWSPEAPPRAAAPFDATQARLHQQAWADYLGAPIEYENSIGMKFRLIPPGDYERGSPADQFQGYTVENYGITFVSQREAEGPQHKVILTHPLYLGVHEVTQQQYQTVMGKNPAWFAANGPNPGYSARMANLDTKSHPVESMTWNDAVEFCVRLSEQETLTPHYRQEDGRPALLNDGQGYRLPTEAEWEFACRAGTRTQYWFGDGRENWNPLLWYVGNSEQRTRPVGTVQANPFGLYDLLGNAAEFCEDAYDKNQYLEFASRPAINPRLFDAGAARHVARGGSVLQSNFGGEWHSAARFPAPLPTNLPSIGFRVALSVPTKKKMPPVEIDRDRRPSITPIAGAGEEWLREVSALPDREQLRHVADKLRKLNPQFDGHLADVIRNDAVEGLELDIGTVSDISPLRSFTNLRHLGLLTWMNSSQLTSLSPLRGLKLVSLSCNQTQVTDLSPLEGMPLKKLVLFQSKVDDLSPLRGCSTLAWLQIAHTPIKDLEPLRGAPLTALYCYYTPVADLAPLRGMPLQQLILEHTQVTDLSPLTDMSLTYLSCNRCSITDLSPLQGMPLAALSIQQTQVTDLSPLADLPLNYLHCDVKSDENARSLRRIKTLQMINNKPVQQFWAEWDAQQPGADK